jgi:two-component sensor histidine kinase
VTLDFAIPIGLLATELLSNAIRHAQASHIIVCFRICTNGDAMLEIHDNGRDPAARMVRLNDRGGTGSRIIAGLTHQLGGQMEIDHDAGVRIAIRMKLPEAA